jgi:hypothetical protein
MKARTAEESTTASLIPEQLPPADRPKKRRRQRRDSRPEIFDP